MPRPRSLTPADIADAALGVIDRDGLGALSMRTVAAELGTGAMSLYRYVKDREELERLVVDQVLAPADIATAPGLAWERQIAGIAHSLWKAVGAHPSTVPLLMRHRHDSRAMHRCTEALLRALTDGGFAGRQRVIALRTLVSYLYGALQAQQLGPLAGAGTDVLAGLAAEEYPLLTATARVARTIRAEEELRGGIAIVLQGLACLRSDP